MARAKNYKVEDKLELAMQLFWERGYHATSIQQLVDSLGINRASIYDSFGSKKGLYMRSLESYANQQTTRMADFLYQFVNVRQGLYALFEYEINSSLNEPVKRGCFWINATAEIANSDAEILNQLEEIKTQFEKVFFNYLQYGVNQGQVSSFKDVNSLVHYFLCIYSGIKTNSKLQSNSTEFLNIVGVALKSLD